MNQKLRKSRTMLGIAFTLLMLIPITGKSQGVLQTVSSKRVKENFDGSWLFHKGDIAIKRTIKSGGYGGLTDANVKVVTGEEAVIAYTDKNKAAVFKRSDWQDVTIPHDWCVEGEFVNDKSTDGSSDGLVSHGFLPVGIGFYRKEFDIPETDKGKKITIEFDGIFRNSTVWVNGHIMGGHHSGYTPSNYDLTEVLRYGNEGKNVILVKVDASDFEGWWYEGCGIYRHVWLNKTDKLHVNRFGTFVTTPSVSTDKADVSIQTTLKNDDNVVRTVMLVSKIVDSKGVVLDTKTSSQTIEPLATAEIAQNGAIQKPLLWSPETPTLYNVLTEVSENGKVIDNYETRFGVRTVELKNTGFYLNGKLYPIKGTAVHQDFAGVGVALPDKINEYKIKLLKEMGCNDYRCSHNPPTPELLDICDRLGMLVLDENRFLSSTDEGLSDLTTLLYRDRNHPCVFMWSMENEESIQGTSIGMRIVKKLVDVTHKIDPTRLTTAAMNHGWNDAGYSDALDVVGYNYGQRGMQYVNDHEKYPQRKMLVTETASFTATRGEYEDNRAKGYVSNFGTMAPGWGMPPAQDWGHVVKYPFLSGMFAWTGFDYRGEPTPIGQWPCAVSHFGIMDYCGFPKDGYYAYKAAWVDAPLVHVFPHWNWPGKEGQKIKVQGYTNCDEVELFVNGKSVGKKTAVPFAKMEWEVLYQPGKLEARGYKGGKMIAKETIETTKAPEQIALSSDCTTLKADGCDVAVIKVAIQDAKGRVVPTANNLMKFSIEGPGRIIGTGNGDPSSHEPDKASQRMAFNGYCMVLVQSDKEAGDIRLKALSENLKGTEVVIKTVK
jgi:beta-galactosidase